MLNGRVLMNTAGLLGLMTVLGCAAGTTPPIATTPTKLDPAVLTANMCGKPESKGKTDTSIPMFTGLAPVHYPVSSANPEVQRYFDQGFALLYGFEYPTAHLSFKKAHELDPDCAICAWGEAMALGPTINMTEMSAKDAAEARALVATALKSPKLTERDRVLLEALAIRYAPGAPSGQGGVYTEKYADAMAQAAQRFADDDIVVVLAAEAAMMVRPWDYWETGGHVALPWGAKAIRLVETVLARNPDQPEAEHLYIHLTEASDNPKRAEASADRLGLLAPNSPHLVHMPTHTYYPLGRFTDAIRVNEAAILKDEDMAQALGEDTLGYGYYDHHAHFIISAAQQVGDAATALKLAAGLEKANPIKKVLETPWHEGSLVMALQARAQFQSPAEVLALPKPDSRLKVVTVAWHAVRAEAFASVGNGSSAQNEIKALNRARKAIHDKEQQPFLEMLEAMARGRIELAGGQYKAAADHFTAAAQWDAQLGYGDPPLWQEPADIALGRTLLMAGDVSGAKAAFVRALRDRPGNAYALWGKAQAEARLGDAAASQISLAAFNKVWLGDKGAISLERL